MSNTTPVAVQSLASIPGIGGVEAGQPVGGVNEGATPAPQEAAPKPVLTARQKLEKQIQDAKARIEKDTKFLEEALPRLQSIDSLDSIAEGTGVTVKLGRAESTRIVQGVVTGVDNEGSTPRYKVFHGTGFNAETVVVLQAQIVSVLGTANASV